MRDCQFAELPGRPQLFLDLLKVDPSAVRTLEGSCLGPILRLRKGQKVRVQFRHQLPEQSKVGGEVVLMSREFLGAEGDTLIGGGMGSMQGAGGMHGMDHGAPHPAATQASGAVGVAPANGALFPVLTVLIERAEEETPQLPASLSKIERYRLEDASNGQQPRTFGMSMRNMQ